MPRSDNLTLIVLKGHLLVEEELNEILNLKLRLPKALFDARLSFNQRLAVLKALLGSERDSGIRFKAIEHLNSLRNKLAHNLEPKALEESVRICLAEFKEPDREQDFSEEKMSVRLKRCLALLCGELSGFNHAGRSLQIPTI